MIILDIFKYFASFVPKDALRRTFRAPDGKQYRALMDEVLSSGSDRVQDGITDFIFGTDADKLATVITSVTGIYLFVEYDRVSPSMRPATARMTAFMWPSRWLVLFRTWPTWWARPSRRTDVLRFYPPYAVL